MLEAPWPPVESYTENPTCWHFEIPELFQPQDLCSRGRPLLNLSRRPLRPRRSRAGPHQPQRKPHRSKSPLPRRLRHPCRPQRSNHPHPETAPRWRPGSLRTKVLPKLIARPTRWYGSTCRQRSITSPERRTTAPRSASTVLNSAPQESGGTSHLPAVNHLGPFWRPWGLDLTHRCGRFAGATTPFLRSGSPLWTSSITRRARAPRNASKSKSNG